MINVHLMIQFEYKNGDILIFDKDAKLPFLPREGDKFHFEGWSPFECNWCYFDFPEMIAHVSFVWRRLRDDSPFDDYAYWISKGWGLFEVDGPRYEELQRQFPH